MSKFTELYGACGKAAGCLCFSAQTVPQLQPVVEMRDLTMQWGPRPVLDRVNLTLRAGERLAVVGPSGAGKSTVLRLLAGLQLPTSGELRLFNKPQTYLRLDQTDPPDVRLVFQNPALLASLTVEENVGFLLAGTGAAVAARDSRSCACLPGGGGALRRGPPLCR